MTVYKWCHVTAENYEVEGNLGVRADKRQYRQAPAGGAHTMRKRCWLLEEALLYSAVRYHCLYAGHCSICIALKMHIN